MTEERELRWEEYSYAARLTEDDIVAAEEALGVTFPDDFIGMMVRYQGMSVDAVVRVSSKRAYPFGPLDYLTRTEGSGTTNNLISSCLILRRGGLPLDLIPFSCTGQAMLALDYAMSPPCVVYMYPREISGDEPEPIRGARINGEWSTVKVADSITDMLAKLEPE